LASPTLSTRGYPTSFWGGCGDSLQISKSVSPPGLLPKHHESPLILRPTPSNLRSLSFGSPPSARTPMVSLSSSTIPFQPKFVPDPLFPTSKSLPLSLFLFAFFGFPRRGTLVPIHNQARQLSLETSFPLGEQRYVPLMPDSIPQTQTRNPSILVSMFPPFVGVRKSPTAGPAHLSGYGAALLTSPIHALSPEAFPLYLLCSRLIIFSLWCC